MKIIAALGDFYHDEEVYRKALLHAVETIEGVNLVVVTREELPEKLKESPELVILGSENRVTPEDNDKKKWLSESEETKIADYVENGGSWFAWHSGLASYEENSVYINMIGGYFTHHPDEHVKVRYYYKDTHELGDGKGSFDTLDEHYFVSSDKDVSIFLNSQSEYGESIAGWTKRYGKGKVCCYTPAHNEKGLMSSAVQRDLKDVVAWLASDED